MQSGTIIVSNYYTSKNNFKGKIGRILLTLELIFEILNIFIQGDLDMSNTTMTKKHNVMHAIIVIAVSIFLIILCWYDVFSNEENQNSDLSYTAVYSDPGIMIDAQTRYAVGNDFEAFDVTVENAKSVDVVTSNELFEVSQNNSDDGIVLTFKPGKVDTYGKAVIYAVDADGNEAVLDINRVAECIKWSPLTMIA